MVRQHHALSMRRLFTSRFLRLEDSSHVFFVACGLLVVSACSAGPDTLAQNVSFRDSAGIKIIESSAPQWGDTPHWVVGAPVVEIGSVDGDSSSILYQVQGAVRLSDGRILVANGGTNELRFFDDNGRHLASIGGTGSGPGEFRWLTRVWVSADSIFAFDNALARVSVFTDRGEFVRSSRLEAMLGSGAPTAQGSFADQTLLVLGAPSGVVPTTKGLIDGAEWTLLRYGAVGQPINHITAERESVRWGHDISGLPPAVYLPFSLEIFPFALHGTSVYVGTGTAFSVRRWENSGRLLSEVRWQGAIRPVSQTDVARYREVMQRARPRHFDSRAWNRYLSEVPFPEFMPTYQRLLVDADGNLWVEQFRTPWEDQPRWWVFDTQGVWLGEVMTPKYFYIFEIGAHFLLGVRRDRLGVEYVTMLPLLRDGRRDAN